MGNGPTCGSGVLEEADAYTIDVIRNCYGGREVAARPILQEYDAFTIKELARTPKRSRCILMIQPHLAISQCNHRSRSKSRVARGFEPDRELGAGQTYRLPSKRCAMSAHRHRQVI